MDNDPLLDALKDEYNKLHSTIQGLVASTDRLVSIGVIIISIGFSFGIKDKILFVIQFIPIAISFLFLYAASTYHNVFYLAGYKRNIEDEINLIIGENVYRWEEICETYVQTNWALLSLLFLISGLYIFTCYISIRETDTSAVVGKSYLALLIFLAVIKLIVLRSVFHSRTVGNQAASKLRKRHIKNIDSVEPQ